MAVPFYFLVIGQAAENNPFQLPVPKSNFKVWVSVSCDDENTKAFIESHVKRELRSLQDVDLVKAGDGIYELIIAAAEPTYEATGRKTGDIGLAWISLKAV